MNVYQSCPVYETESFIIRQVRAEDAPALLKVYSDRDAVSRMNADFCTSDFYFETLEEMEKCISFWLNEYALGYYVRFSVILKTQNTPIGTVEIFGGEGVLRLDIRRDFDREKYTKQLVALALTSFKDDFGITSLKIKTKNTPDRVEFLNELGFVPSKLFRPELGYHEYNF